MAENKDRIYHKNRERYRDRLSKERFSNSKSRKDDEYEIRKLSNITDNAIYRTDIENKAYYTSANGIEISIPHYLLLQNDIRSTDKITIKIERHLLC